MPEGHKLSFVVVGEVMKRQVGGCASPIVRRDGIDYLRGEQKETDSKAAANCKRVADFSGWESRARTLPSHATTVNAMAGNDNLDDSG